jgi:hypothetical protein
MKDWNGSSSRIVLHHVFSYSGIPDSPRGSVMAQPRVPLCRPVPPPTGVGRAVTCDAGPTTQQRANYHAPEGCYSPPRSNEARPSVYLNRTMGEVANKLWADRAIRGAALASPTLPQE